MPVSKRAVSPWSNRRRATAVRSSVAALPTCASDSPIVCALEPPVPTPITTRPGARSGSVAIALAGTETWREGGTGTPGPRRIRDEADLEDEPHRGHRELGGPELDPPGRPPERAGHGDGEAEVPEPRRIGHLRERRGQAHAEQRDEQRLEVEDPVQAGLVEDALVGQEMALDVSHAGEPSPARVGSQTRSGALQRLVHLADHLGAGIDEGL